MAESDVMTISDYCKARINGEHCSFAVEPTKEVIEFISSNMLNLDYDEIYFEIIERIPSKEILVVAKYNSIIGSRWLAILPAGAMDRFKEAA